MTLFTPPVHPLPTPLYSPSPSPTSLHTSQLAIQNACRRWPPLVETVRNAAALTDANTLYTHPVTPQILAWCWEQTMWRYHQVTATRTGFGCSCPDWPPPFRAGPGDGQYCPHILAWLLAIYLHQPLLALPFSAEALWEKTLADLKRQMTKGTFDAWLVWSQVVPETSTPLQLTVRVSNGMAQDWLTQRLSRVIRRTLIAQAGYPIDVTFVVSR